MSGDYTDLSITPNAYNFMLDWGNINKAIPVIARQKP